MYTQNWGEKNHVVKKIKKQVNNLHFIPITTLAARMPFPRAAPTEKFWNFSDVS